MFESFLPPFIVGNDNNQDEIDCTSENACFWDLNQDLVKKC